MKIYPADWQKTHPYSGADSTDSFYARIVGEVIGALNLTGLSDVLDDDKLERVAFALTSWFEDVISEVGVWRSFTEVCKKRYGCYLPFFNIEETGYYPDEINQDDVQFLLWHYVQQENIGRALMNPENVAIKLASILVYGVFDSYYETAPENTKLKNFFTSLKVDGENFYALRDVLAWLRFDCFFSVWNEEQFLASTYDLLEDFDDDFFSGDDFVDRMGLLTYYFHVNDIMSGRNLLGLTTYQWLGRILDDKTKEEKLLGLKYRHDVYLSIEMVDKDYVYARELGAEDKLIKININFCDKKTIKTNVGKVVLTSLIEFDGELGISGTVVAIDRKTAENNVNSEKQAAQMKKDTYDVFTKKVKGNKFFFFSDTDEYKDFMNDLFLNGDDDALAEVAKEHEGSDVFVYASPKNGIFTMFDSCTQLKSRKNPLYDNRIAKKEAHSLVLDTAIPYEISTMLIEKGMLADARMSSTKGVRYGRKLMQLNINFINDYFRKNCKENMYLD